MIRFLDAVEAADIMDPVDGDFGDPAVRMSYLLLRRTIAPSVNSIGFALLGSSRNSRRWTCVPSFSVALLWCPNSGPSSSRSFLVSIVD